MDVLEAVGPLNAFLCDLHGPTTSIAQTMRQLVPFPDEIGSLPDADLLDLTLETTTGAERLSAQVRVAPRYATSATVQQATNFYLTEFAGAGIGVSDPVSLSAGARVVLDAQLNDADDTRYRVSIDDFRGYRSVRVEVRYGGFDHRALFARFAEWHSGEAPISDMNVATGLEISTFASGRRPSTLVLYSTHYECDMTPRAQMREMVDGRLDELGWSYREPRDGIMFIQDGLFEAETHVSGDEHGSSVSFVGEFQLR